MTLRVSWPKDAQFCSCSPTASSSRDFLLPFTRRRPTCRRYVSNGVCVHRSCSEKLSYFVDLLLNLTYHTTYLARYVTSIIIPHNWYGAAWKGQVHFRICCRQVMKMLWEEQNSGRTEFRQFLRSTRPLWSSRTSSQMMCVPPLLCRLVPAPFTRMTGIFIPIRSNIT